MRTKSKPERPVRGDLSSIAYEIGARLRGVSVLALPVALSACAVTAPVDITSTSGTLPPAIGVELAEFPVDESLRGRFGSALTEAFAAANIQLETGSAVIAEFAVAERNASSGTADPAASSPDEIVWSSEPRNPRWLDECDARRLSGTLVLLSRQDGSLLYRGVAEATDCTFDETHFRTMAQALVANAQSR